jgi:PAS domain S-box-containing protein
MDKLGRSSQRNALMNQIFDSMPQMTFQADAEGNIISFNQRWYDYIGPGEETEGWKWKDRVVHHPDDLERTVATWQHSIQTGTPYEIEYRLRRSDGQFRWHLGRAVPLKDEHGKVTGWFGTNTDIHELKESRERAALAEQRLNLALQASDIGFWDWDPTTGLTTLSETLMKNWGMDPSKFNYTLNECLERIHPDDRDRIWAEILNSRHNRRKYDVEYRVLRPDGKVIDVNAKGELLLNPDGSPQRFTGVAMDITERKRAERELNEARIAAEQANEAKSAFLANISHEIRTPLGAIMGFSDLALQPQSSPADIASYLQVIQRNSMQVLRIVDDVLDLAKVEAGKTLIETMEVNPFSLLNDFHAIMDFRAKENGITFQLEIETEIPDRLQIDPTRVRQILNNAVGNAIKFTSKGGVVLHVCYNGGFLEFSINDTGRGISQEQAKNLFQAFAQADVSTTRRFGGTGLGLILTKRLCQAMGGDFTLERSAPNLGSQFLARIQAPSAPGAKMVRPQSLASFEHSTNRIVKDGGQQLDGLRILVVEDSPDNQDLLRIMLEQEGAQFELAENGAEGVEKALTGEHNVVLMDIQMPGMDGHEAARSLRAKGYRRPIIALTAHAMKEEQEKTLRSGFTDYLSKPINRPVMFDMIRRYTESRN